MTANAGTFLRVAAWLLVCSACQHSAAPSTAPSAVGTLGSADAAAAVASGDAANTDAHSVPSTAVRDQSDCPEGMLFIPTSDFSIVGQVPGKKDRSPQRQSFHVEAFCIDRTEVPMQKYVENECGKPERDCRHEVHSDGPAACITPEQAECHCEKAASGLKKRLPTDPEWLLAALGTDGRTYPWGNTPYPPNYDSNNRDFCPDQGNVPSSFYLCRPESNTLDRSPYGVIGMATNGEEITGTRVVREEAPQTAPYSVLRGASIGSGLTSAIADVAGLVPTDGAGGSVAPNVSFRCATSERVQR